MPPLPPYMDFCECQGHVRFVYPDGSCSDELSSSMEALREVEYAAWEGRLPREDASYWGRQIAASPLFKGIEEAPFCMKLMERRRDQILRDIHSGKFAIQYAFWLM